MRSGTAAQAAPVVDLLSRTASGLEVTLLYDRSDGRLWVRVVELLGDGEWAIETPPGRARDVFEHPFAYVDEGYRRAA